MHISLQVMFLIVTLNLGNIECFFLSVPKRPRDGQKFSVIQDGQDPGEPLFLTPLIEAGKIKRAQHEARVHPSIGNTTSYSGFLTVDKNCENNLFFWFFPAQINPETSPVVLWLQGGPGSPSLYGLFEELGPFNSYSDGLQTRNYSWNLENNLLFIDQPAGTGYSFTGKNCYRHNETEIGQDLYAALFQFFQLFPALQNNRFIITGESYAGHYIPAIGYTIYKNNHNASLKINLKGMMIGDGWMDPREQINYADYLFQTGFIDESTRNEYYNIQQRITAEIDETNWKVAVNIIDEYTDEIVNRTGFDIYNFLPHPADNSNWYDFVQLSKIRRAIHVGSSKFDDSWNVYFALIEDYAQSVKPWVEELLEFYPIVFYAGQVMTIILNDLNIIYVQ